MIIEHKGKFSTDEILALTILKVFNKGKIYIKDDTKDFYNIDFIDNEISSTVEEIFKSRDHRSSRMSDELWKHLGKQFLKEADYPEDLWNTLYKRIILPSYDEFPSFCVRHLEQMTNYTEILYERTSMFSASFKYVLQSCVDWFEHALKGFAKEYSLIECGYCFSKYYERICCLTISFWVGGGLRKVSQCQVGSFREFC